MNTFTQTVTLNLRYLSPGQHTLSLLIPNGYSCNLTLTERLWSLFKDIDSIIDVLVIDCFCPENDQYLLSTFEISRP